LLCKGFENVEES